MNKISLQDYEGLHYDKEKLREACKLPAPKGLRLYSLSSSWVDRFIRPHMSKNVFGEGKRDVSLPWELLVMIHGPQKMETVKKNGEARHSDTCALGLGTTLGSA